MVLKSITSKKKSTTVKQKVSKAKAVKEPPAETQEEAGATSPELDAVVAPPKRGRPKGPTPGSEIRNGVRRPDPGTIGGAIWALCDESLAEKGRTLTWSELNAKFKEYGDGCVSHASLHFNYCMHKKFNGITGRVKE